MAIVRILKSSNKFPAVKYNYDRCTRGEAELVKAVNFNIDSSIISHSDYLQKWGVGNTRIKNNQFHITISPDKGEMTKEELINLGERWMKEMGYADNPYLIFYHKNTEHPHIHIISSRVGKDGKKINDSFENEKAVQILNKLVNKSSLKEERKLLSQLLKYSFSTKYQFIELCKSSGYKVQFNDKNVSLSKSGNNFVVSNELIDFCSKRYHKILDEKEKKRIQSLIYKYALKYSKENFMTFMRRKFGLEFIFYGKEEGNINGYTIIDHRNRTIYKGSEIFGAKKIGELLNVPQNDSDIILLVKDLMNDNVLCDLEMLKSILCETYYYGVDDDYNIIDLFSEEVVGKLTPDLLSKLDYNKRVKYYADAFRPYNSELASIIARFAKVKVSDMNILSSYSKPSADILESINSLIVDALKSGSNIYDFLNAHHLAMVVSADKFFIIDYVNGISVSSDDLKVDYQDVLSKLQDNDELHQDDDNTLQYEYDDVNSFILNPPVIDIAGLFYTGRVVGSNTNKKKKRKV